MATNLRMKEKPGEMIGPKQIQDHIYNLNILNTEESKRFCKVFLDTLEALMLNQEDIAVEGFGILYADKTKPKKKWYDISQGKCVTLEPTIKYRFRAASKLRRAITRHRGYVELTLPKKDTKIV
jgi:nucleoid DNA-binding protein